MRDRKATDRRRRYPKKFRTEARAFLKSHPLCEYCSAMGRATPSELVDHIEPIAKGGSVMDKSNWAAACHGCHRSWIASLEKGGDPGPFIGRDGLPVASPLLDRAVEAKASETVRQAHRKHMEMWRRTQ